MAEPTQTNHNLTGVSGEQVSAYIAAENLSVNRVAIRTPPFCKDRPALWFASLEAQFSINNITQEITKFNYAIAHLDTNCTREVEDIILQPPKEQPYSKLRNAIISRFSESHEQKVRRLLEKEHIGDRKPSSFLRHLKSLAGPMFPDDLLKTIWTSRLPRYLQIVLAAQRLDTLAELSELADNLMEINTQPATYEVCASQSSSTPSHTNADIQGLINKVDELTRIVAALTTSDGSGHNGRGRGRSSNRNRSRSRSRNPQLCFYHDRFAAKARKCIQPCNWSGPPPNNQENPNSSR